MKQGISCAHIKFSGFYTVCNSKLDLLFPQGLLSPTNYSASTICPRSKFESLQENKGRRDGHCGWEDNRETEQKNVQTLKNLHCSSLCFACFSQLRTRSINKNTSCLLCYLLVRASAWTTDSHSLCFVPIMYCTI